MRTMATVFVSLFTASLAQAESGAELQPLDPGRSWTYGDGMGNVAVLRIAGTRVVQGVEATVVRWEVNGEVKNESYQTHSSTGELLVHGLITWPESSEVSYEPPLVFAAADIVDGAKWCTDILIYHDLDGSELHSDFNACYESGIQEDVVVPAGAFAARSVQYVTTIDPTFGETGTWRSPGIGIVAINRFGAWWELTSYVDPTTPLALHTWSSLKAAFD